MSATLVDGAPASFFGDNAIPPTIGFDLATFLAEAREARDSAQAALDYLTVADSLPLIDVMDVDDIVPVTVGVDRGRTSGAAVVRMAAYQRAGLVYDSVAQAADLVGLLSLPYGATILTAGYASAHDGGGAPYVKVVSEPSHPGKFYDGEFWWELRTSVFRPDMFASIEDAAGNATVPFQAALDRAARVGGVLDLLPKTYLAEKLVAPRANGSGGVSGEVKRLEIRGMCGSFSDSGTIIKTISGSDNAAIIASEAWATNGTFYQSGWALRDLTLDGSGIAANGIATSAADVVIDRVFIRNVVGTGLLHTQTTQDGVTQVVTRPDRCRFNQLMIRDCGVGFSSPNAADCTLTLSEIWHCGVCVDIYGSGWQVDNLRTYTQVATTDYVVRFAFGQGCRVTNCVFGGASSNTDVYQVDLIHRFDPIFFSANEISGPAGRGVRCSTTQANNRGLITISECTFTNEAGATTSTVWAGTNSASFVVDVVDCVFRISEASEPFGWVAGAEAALIFARNCRKMDASAQGVAVIYEGLQRPGIISTRNPGVFVTGANPVTLDHTSKMTVVRAVALTSTTVWNLPATAGEDQSFTLVRAASATGSFVLEVRLSDTTLLTTLPVPSRRVVVKYLPSLAQPWQVVENTAIDDPMEYGTPLPGVTRTAANPYVFNPTTKSRVSRSTALSSATSWVLPATAGDGQTYELIRPLTAAGIHVLSVYESDATTLVATLPVPGRRVVVMYVEALGGWEVVDSGAIEEPQTYGVDLPGLVVTGANPFVFTATTKRCVVRNAALISTTVWNLPATGLEGQSYELVRSTAATGAFNLEVRSSDGSVLFKAMSTAGYRVVVRWAPTLATWLVVDSAPIN